MRRFQRENARHDYHLNNSYHADGCKHYSPCFQRFLLGKPAHPLDHPKPTVVHPRKRERAKPYGEDLRSRISALARARGWPLRELTKERHTLEDIFIHITRSEEEF